MSIAPSATAVDPMLVLALHRRSFGTIRPSGPLAALAPAPQPGAPRVANRAARRRAARLRRRTAVA
jgi:hypothetical protein